MISLYLKVNFIFYKNYFINKFYSKIINKLVN